MPARRARLADVAARAGVSAATASRSLRGIPKVSDDTRQRVLDAARELSYVTAWQAAQSEGRRVVGVIVPFITRWFFSTATASAADYLRAHGYDVLLYHLGSPDVRDSFFERLPLADRVDGILSLSMPLSEDHTLSLRALGLPLVSIGSTIPGFPSAGIDEVAASRSAVNHLLNLGHTRIGFIAGRPDDARFDFTASGGRRRGYEQALIDAGIKPSADLVVDGPHGIGGGTAAMTELLSRPNLPTAVFAEFDELAVGAIAALQRVGLRVPTDVSVIGIDDHEVAEFARLTTIGQDVGEQGRVAAHLLLQMLGAEPGSFDDQPVRIPTRLVLRGTTAPPPRHSPAAASGTAAAALDGRSATPEPT